MTNKLRLVGLMLVVLLSLSAPLQAAGQTQTGSLHGNVLDPTGAVVAGAVITLTHGSQVLHVKSGAHGQYAFHDLAPGTYFISVNAVGFSPLAMPGVTVAAGQSKNLNLSLNIAIQQQQITVTGSAGPTVSTAPDSNTNAIVLKGSALNALSSDPDELANELQALAGPSAGPSGGQIYIDGFTGGQLPPKSAIREIRINRDPFSAEYDRLGYGRIEILTKPGTQKFHGRVFGMGNDNAFNTLNPFTATIPSYHSYMYDGTLSGPISKHASFFISAQQRNFQNDEIYNASTAVLDPTTNTYVEAPEVGGLLSPQTHTNISPRVDFQLGQNNTLTLRYQFFRNQQSNMLGGSVSLPSQASSRDSVEHTFQFDDSQIVSNNLVNETRFEYRRGSITETPVSTAPTVDVPTYFSGGGNAAQHMNDHTDHFELQNFSTLTAGPHTVTFGAWLRDNRESLTTDSGFNGSFSFSSLPNYLELLNDLAADDTFAQIAATCPACLPVKLNYAIGPTSFTANLFDGALFYQDDWKVKPYLTLSDGLRFETQNHVADHADWAPRVAFAYALDGHQAGARQKTVLRGGFGWFYQRFDIGYLMNLEQYNAGPHAQKQIVVTNPTCYSSTSLSDIPGGVASCGSSTASQPYTITSTYHSPYTEILGLSLERQLTKSSTLTFSWLRSYGLHGMVVRDANAYEPLPGTVYYNSTTGPRPNPAFGPIDQYYSEGMYKENQIIVNVNAQLSRKLGVFGFYNYSEANADFTQASSEGGTVGAASSPSNSYDLMQDYGRASWVHPQWALVVGNYAGPWGLTFTPFMIAHQGHPYDITTSTDLTGDNFFNDRPAYANPSNCPSTSSNYAPTTFGCLNVRPGAGAAIVPANLGNSPASVAVNMRLSRSFGVGPRGETSGGPPPPGGGGGGGGRGGRGGFNPGGPFGSPGGMRAALRQTRNSGRKYSLQFSVSALNLFNNVDYGTPSGSLIPTPSSAGAYVPDARFGRSTSLAGGIFSSGSAVRRIFVQAAFQF
ncbi:MAG TPA: carboxypeptidase regulatory-like domain-containing protein [Terracidiphilus sp.]|nr:carboxypeptidase regulatory-like domain-containing protein [Terracidiphilus sp.]